MLFCFCCFWSLNTLRAESLRSFLDKSGKRKAAFLGKIEVTVRKVKSPGISSGPFDEVNF